MKIAWLSEGGYTGKTPEEMKYDELISDFVSFEKVVEKYL